MAEPKQHPGVRALSLGLYKGMVHEDPSCQAYIGKNLHRFLRKAISTSLPEGVETDLLENHDSIMGALNLVRFLCLKDPKNSNATGIWTMNDPIKNDFLTPLRKGIDLSRAHFRLELTKLENDKSNPQKKSIENQMDIQILNKQMHDADLDVLPPDHEQQAIKMGLVKFDMMESVLVRVVEIME